jgi:hypothetical protein
MIAVYALPVWLNALTLVAEKTITSPITSSRPALASSR